MPQVKVINLDTKFMVGDQVVSGEFLVDVEMESIGLTCVDNKNLVLTANGEDVAIDLDNHFVLDLTSSENIDLKSEETDLY